MTDILFGNNNRPVLKLLAKRSLKAQKNTIAVLAIMLAALLFTSLSVTYYFHFLLSVSI
ncbi:hypothetical protein [Blautia glucerasea]|uniref:hypothetical protein n=1 Tax=Blautia glucerasea TaxID=536633 RepID=UPI0015706362|nr:hypothetical protein [Blautia glucerasea]NSL05694.1 hypothetical protein [Blautia glucerasea]